MRKLLILLCFSLAAQVMTAQLPSDSSGKKKKKTDRFVYITLGPQMSTINGDSDSYDEMLFGFHAGIGLRLLEFNDQFGLRTELNYSTQGSKYNDTYFSGKVVTSYINLPIVVRGASKGGFYGEAGVQPGLLLSARDKYDDNDDDYKDFINSFDFSGLLGIGYHKNRVGVGIRLANGFTNINKDSDDKDHNFVLGLRGTFTF